jgi:hypothetical protein
LKKQGIRARHAQLVSVTMLKTEAKQHAEAEVQVILSDNLLEELEMQVGELKEKKQIRFVNVWWCC